MPINMEDEMGDVLKIGIRTFELGIWGNTTSRISKCDITIQPDVEKYGLFEVSQTDQIYQAGYEAMLVQIPKIKSLLGAKAEIPTQKTNDLSSLSFGKIVKRTRIMKFGSNKQEKLIPPSSGAMQPPATLFYAGRKREGDPAFSLIEYDQEKIIEEKKLEKEKINAVLHKELISWLNIDGVHEMQPIEFFGKTFGLHPLTAEDIVQTQQRATLETYPEYIYFSLKMMSLDPQDERIDMEQVSLVLGDHFVLSFQEKTEDVLERLRNRLRNAMGRVRRRDADYLFYSIIDLIVSNYAVVTEELDERIERLEIRLDKEENKSLLEEIQELKKGLLYLKSAISPFKTRY